MYAGPQLAFGLLAASLYVPCVVAVDQTKDADLVDKLRIAPTRYDRSKLLPTNDDWIFNFADEPNYTFEPGSVVNANVARFPAVEGNGMTMAMLNLGPCSMLPTHLHPRATNFVVAVSGTTHTWMIEENGARTVETELTPGKMTIFPAGSVHMMQNIGCENAQLMSALNSEDSGTTNLANALFSLPSEQINAVLGYTGVNTNNTVAGIPQIGTGAIYGSKECMAKCAKARKL